MISICEVFYQRQGEDRTTRWLLGDTKSTRLKFQGLGCRELNDHVLAHLVNEAQC